MVLWHWPVLIVAQSVFHVKGHAAGMLAVLAVSLLAATVSYHFIEKPIRFGWFAAVASGKQILIALLSIGCMAVLLMRWNNRASNIVFSREQSVYEMAKEDMPVIYGMGCDAFYHSSEVTACLLGNEDAPKTVVLLGDSIGAQWEPTILCALDPEEWKLLVHTKSSCPIVDESIYNRRIGAEYKVCAEWRDNGIRELKNTHIDALFIGSTSSCADLGEQKWKNGTQRILDRLMPVADAIYIIETNPVLEFDGPFCLEKIRHLSPIARTLPTMKDAKWSLAFCAIWRRHNPRCIGWKRPSWFARRGNARPCATGKSFSAIISI